MTSTFNYSVSGEHAGRFTIPAFEVAVAGQRVRVPPAVLAIVQRDASTAPYQPVRANSIADVFVGESIGGRLLLIETPDESPQFISHVAKTERCSRFRPSMRNVRASSSPSAESDSRDS